MDEVLYHAEKLAVPIALVAGREILRKTNKSKKKQNGGKINFKGGFYKELLEEAKKIAVPTLLVAGRELIKKSTQKKKIKGKKK